MFKTKKEKIKEQEKTIEFLREKLANSSKELVKVQEENYVYKRLFSKLFTRLSASSVAHYKVENNLTDGLAIFNIDYVDGTKYVYEVKLLSVGYEEDLNVQVNKAG